MEKVKKTEGSGVALTLFLILVVLALIGGVAYVIFGMDVLPGLPEQGETTEAERRSEGTEGTEGTVVSQNPSFVPIVLPEGAGDDDVTPFAQAAPADGDALVTPEAPAAGQTGETDGTDSGGGSDGAETAAEPDGGTEAPAASGAEAPAAVDYATANQRPKGLTMSTEDFTVTKIGQKTQLSASGGAGVYNWISQNPAIATVDASGLVTAVASGTTNVLATDGVVKGVCVVRVKALSDEYSLNKTDFTRSVGEGPYQLKLSGYDGPILWTSSNPAAATVSSDGTVTPVAAGFAVITASWENHSRQCFVHVTA